MAIQHAQTTNPKSRNNRTTGKKGRGKNEAASPAININSTSQDRHSPSFSSGPPPSMSAFAGASFHASPAPSALPIPSFLARTASAPDSPSLNLPMPGLSQEPSPPSTDSEENDSSSYPPIVPRNEESPLEFFFKADRAEKARTRRASSANAAADVAGVALGPFSPPHDPSSPKEFNTFPRTNGVVQARRPNMQRNPSSGISSTELDGTPGKPLGPAFSTPYSERIRAARSNNSSVQATPTATQLDFDRSEALKRYLFSGQMSNQAQRAQGQAHSQANSPQGTHPEQSRGVFPGGTPPQAQRQPPHAASVDTQSDQVRRMEDSLRRVLKLGPSA
jgi:hypothetical protein